MLINQKAQALRNLDQTLKAAGSSLDNAVKVNIFLSSMDHYAGVNKAYAEFFNTPVKPVSIINSLLFYLQGILTMPFFQSSAGPVSLLRRCR